MKIKKYVARDFQAALQLAKQEMGRDAIILHTRQVKPRGFWGLFSPRQVEITVAADETLQVNTDRGRQAGQSTPAQAGIVTAGEVKTTPEVEQALLQEMQKMKELMTDIQAKMCEVDLLKGMTEAVHYFYEILVNNNVDKRIALEIAASVEARLPESGDESWVRDVCLHTLQEYLQNIDPIKLESGSHGHLVFVVGPTGVGKTTTIAKLAANMTFLDNKQAALITLDTYRISAAEQLRTFADIIGIPISVAFTAADLQAALEEFKQRDIIFVDTAGRSPNNKEHMAELRQLVDIANPDEIILVLSVTTSSQDLINIYRQFAAMPIHKIIFTKLDETYRYGQIINVLNEVKLPLAYCTTGQNVPDDIEVPNSLHIATMLLKGDET
ncbi:MAG: flagellar biosynthesis protein FlhF [Syntrophomonadaceae bacterium]|jgi:flagellar biosynthesis protein FlhF